MTKRDKHGKFFTEEDLKCFQVFHTSSSGDRIDVRGELELLETLNEILATEIDRLDIERMVLNKEVFGLVKTVMNLSETAKETEIDGVIAKAARMVSRLRGQEK